MTKDIRDNRQYCAICYFTPAAITGFGMSVPNGIAAIIGLDTNCGAPGELHSSVVFLDDIIQDFLRMPMVELTTTY